MKNKVKYFGVFLCCISLSGCWNTSEGQKTGIIVKFAREGLLVKTYEAELIRGGFSNGSGANGQSFHFSVEKKEMAEKLKGAFENHKEVIIKYHSEVFALW